MSDARRCPDPRLVITRALPDAIADRLDALFRTEHNRGDIAMTREQLREAMARCDVLVPTVTDRIDAELLAGAGNGLRLIANFGNGVDHIDLRAARARGIVVTNTPGVLTEDTADMAAVLILALPRRLAEGERLVRSGAWTGWRPGAMLGNRLAGRTLAILGMGRIGQAVARRVRAFGLDVIYHNRRRLPAVVEEELGATWEPNLDGLLARADILSVHAPHTSETDRLLDARRLALLRPHVYLVNTARAQIIDETALIDALEEGRLAGAALDVYWREPHVDPRLLALPNVLLLPHTASSTREGRMATGEKVVANIRAWADGHRPPDQVLEGWA